MSYVAIAYRRYEGMQSKSWPGNSAEWATLRDLPRNRKHVEQEIFAGEEGQRELRTAVLRRVKSSVSLVLAFALVDEHYVAGNPLDCTAKATTAYIPVSFS